MKKSFLFLADGFEEVEALGVVDVLRRGTIEVKTVSISDKKEVTGAHGVPVMADLLLSDVKEEEAEFLICPGGMPGAKNLGDCTALVQMIQKHFDKSGYVAAICAAPALVIALFINTVFKRTIILYLVIIWRIHKIPVIGECCRKNIL